MKSVLQAVKQVVVPQYYGKVCSVRGLLLEVSGELSDFGLGCRCLVWVNDQKKLWAEIVGFHEDRFLVMVLGSLEGIKPGARVDFFPNELLLYPDSSWCGRMINAFGDPIDDKGPLVFGQVPIGLRHEAVLASKRRRVEHRIDVGVRAMNTFLTTCRGQRLGIFAGSGVGKSMLMSMLARFTEADAIVIGMIGERGREVREFIEVTLGEEGLKRSIIVVATGDEPPLVRRQAAYVSLSVAESLREQGLSVLLLMDSVTRFAMAQREIGLAVGEPPTTKGYTPSVFTELSRLLERAGPGEKGDMTAFFTVLVDGDDHNEPIADAVRGILDGHIVLDRALAGRGHYPAINILKSISRTVPMCLSEAENKDVNHARQMLSTYEDMSDMIRIGAYRAGASPDVDYAIAKYPKLEKFLCQNWQDRSNLDEDFSQLSHILNE